MDDHRTCPMGIGATELVAPRGLWRRCYCLLQISAVHPTPGLWRVAKMKKKRLVRWLALTVSMLVASLLDPLGSQAALDSNSPQGGFSSTAPEAPGVSAARPAGPEPRGNPLWAIPLVSLIATRERPIFLPSRRPLAPPVVAGPPPTAPAPPPPPAAPPERPRLLLVGAVVGDSEAIAILIDQNNQGIVRLRTGENHLGWTLSAVKGREATLQKGQETMQLALPAPDETQAGMPGLPGLGFPGMRPPGIPAPRNPSNRTKP